MLMTIAEYLKPLMPYSVIITLIGFIITWIYKKKQDKREYEPRLSLGEISIEINNINVIYDSITPIRFVENEREDKEKNLFYSLIKIINSGEKEAKELELKWSIENIDNLFDEINLYLKNIPNEARQIYKVIHPEGCFWIKSDGFFISGCPYPRLSRIKIIAGNTVKEPTLIDFDNTYIYLICLLIFLRLNSLPNNDSFEQNYIEQLNQLNNLPSSILSISYQDIYDKSYQKTFTLKPCCSFYTRPIDPLKEEHNEQEQLRDLNTLSDNANIHDNTKYKRIINSICYNLQNKERLGVCFKFEVTKQNRILGWGKRLINAIYRI